MVLQIVVFKASVAVDMFSIMHQLAAVILAHTIENIMVERQIVELSMDFVSANATTELSSRIHSDNKNRIVA